MSDDKEQQSDETQALKAEADAARARIAGRVERLQRRLQPRRLVREAVSEATSAARQETMRTARMVRAEVADVADDAMEWVRDNRALVGAVAAGAGALLAYSLYQRRREAVVPIYDAYSMEDPAMMNETDYGSTYDDAASGRDAGGQHAARRWDRVREGAEHLGARASERYQSAREAMSERYHSTREAAGERYGALSEATRERYTQAADWTKRQPTENPMGTVIAGFALGALLGALLPRTQAENRALGPTKDKLSRQAREQAQAALDAGKAKLAEAGITPEAAKSKLGELVDEAKHVAKDVAGAAASQVKPGGGQSDQGSTNAGYSSGTAAMAGNPSNSAASGGASTFGTSPSTPSL